ncbi:MAG: type 4a pilus biogenesis protein PilO [bacterium]|nr:type 4a pilus biogenesis protein PilO [bacterium]
MRILDQYIMPVSFLLFVGALFLAIFAVWPQVEEFRSLGLQHQEVNGALGRAEQYLKSTKAAQAMIEEHQEDVARVREAIPTDPNIALLYQRLFDGASAAGVVIDTISANESPTIGEEAVDQELQSVEIVARVSGSYTGVKGFLQEVLRSYRIMTIKSLMLSSISEEGEATRFSLDVRAQAYYMAK